MLTIPPIIMSSLVCLDTHCLVGDFRGVLYPLFSRLDYNLRIGEAVKNSRCGVSVTYAIHYAIHKYLPLNSSVRYPL